MQGVPGPLPPLRSLRRIAVFRALQLGDMLCVVPALRTLRRAAPDANITLIGLPWARGFARRFSHYVDDFLAFPGFPGLPEQAADVAALPKFLLDAGERRFELAIQLHGSGGLSNPIVALLGAGRQAGFYAEGGWCPDPRACLAWGQPEHEILRYLRLMQWIGCGGGDAALEFPFNEADQVALRAVEHLPTGRFVCLHAGARLPSRRWPAARFAQVADGLAARGWEVILTGGEQEREIASQMRRNMAAPALDLTGRTTLGALALLVSRAGLLVSNDTAVSHLAAASGTPSVIISSGADPVRWAPLDHRRHRVLAATAPCRPCSFGTCPVGHPCALGVSVAQVLDAALEVGEECSRGPQWKAATS